MRAPLPAAGIKANKRSVKAGQPKRRNGYVKDDEEASDVKPIITMRRRRLGIQSAASFL
jgi:hypothetical protein